MRATSVLETDENETGKDIIVGRGQPLYSSSSSYNDLSKWEVVEKVIVQ